MVENVKPYKIHTPVHSQNPGLSTTNSTQSYVFAPSNGYGDNTPIDKPQVSRDCWPAAGECHSCGFGPQQRVGTICIGHTKVCDYCRTPGHITKACKRGPGSDVVKPSTLADTPVQDPKKRVPQQTKPTYTANPPVDQSKRVDLGAETNFPGEDTHDAMHRSNIGRENTMTANDNPAYGTSIDEANPHRKTAQERTPTWNIGAQENPKGRTSATSLWGKFSRTINMLKAAATHRLTATTLSLSERDGIGVLLTTPNLVNDKGREDHCSNFQQEHRI